MAGRPTTTASAWPSATRAGCFLPGGDHAEAGVHQEGAVEACPEVLDQFAGGLVVQDAEVGEVERGDAVHQHLVGGADIGGVRFGDALDVVLGRDADADAVGATAATTALTVSITKRARFSGEPP